jgi:diguanylate cyclase (GGDEF)-like protein/PAS domain S-box-containing protein
MRFFILSEEKTPMKLTSILLMWITAVIIFEIIKASGILSPVFYTPLVDSILNLVITLAVFPFIFQANKRENLRHHETAAALKETEARYNQLLELSSEAIVIHNDCIIQYANPAAIRLSGVSSKEEIIGDSIFSYIHPDSHQTFRERYERKKAGQAILVETMDEQKFIRKDGSVYYVELVNMGITIRQNPATLSIIKDISGRKHAEQRLRYMAYYDALSGLPNRRMFRERLIAKLEKTGSHRLAIMFLDMDRFKLINDSLGHSFGDLALKIVAERLVHCIGDTGLVARMGGDEFIILLERIEGINDAVQSAESILNAFKEPLNINDHELRLAPSIGICLYPDHGRDADTIMKFADSAMYQAKQKGGWRYQVYTPEINIETYERIMLENDLNKALKNNEFILHYQPSVNVSTGKIIGMEALIRWVHPRMGVILPDKFIPLAEETGLIISIGEWVIKSACLQIQKWMKEKQGPLQVSVNVSAKQFQQPNLLNAIETGIHETGIPAYLLKLEITESSLLKNAESIVDMFLRLKQLGVKISIDDFGTGYSSFQYLRKLNVHTLKIDKTFVQAITFDQNDRTIVSAIINLAHNLNLDVVAEGVETDEQLKLLKEMDCDHVQGYLYGPPVPADQIDTIFAGKE